MGDIVRKCKNGRFIGWYVRFRDADGRRKQRASHQPSHALARRFLLEVEGRIARGLVGIPELASSAPTVAALCARWLEEYRGPGIKDLGRYRAQARLGLRRVLPHLGEVRLDQLTRLVIEQARDRLCERYPEPNTLRASLRPLSSALSWAVQQGLLAHNPLRGLALPPRVQSLEYLPTADATRLLQAAEARARASAGTAAAEAWSHFLAVAIALYTGLRRGEIMGLRWSDLDLEAQQLTVARSFRVVPKGGRPRHLRLPSALVPLLAEWRPLCPRTADGVLCPARYKGRFAMSRGRSDHGLKALLAAAGCPPLRRGWHALRHTFASAFIRSGGHLLALQQILGHRDVKMTQIYAHLAPDFLARDMERIRY
jgi:integrase